MIRTLIGTLYLVVLFVVASVPASAQIITGTFDWTGVSYNSGDAQDPEADTASFSYDSATNVGTLTNFYPGFVEFFVATVVTDPYGGGSLSDPADPLSNIAAPITTFAGLTDFSDTTKESPGFSLNGQPAVPFSYTISNVWNLNGKGGINNTNWSANDGVSLNPTIFTGTISNFRQTPEPSTWIELALGALCLVMVGARLRTRRV